MPSTIGITSSAVNQEKWDTLITADAPYGWWKLNELTGNLVQSGSVGGAATAYIANSGRTTNAAALQTYSGSTTNYSFNFNSTATVSNRLNVTNFGTNIGSNNAVSMEMIFKINTSTGRATFGRQRADALGWGLLTSVSTGNIYVTAWFGNIFTRGIDMNTLVPWDANKWYHVVYTYAPTETCLYLNGKLIQSISHTSATFSDSTNNCDLFSSFGGSFDKSQSSNIDEMCMYKTTLTAAQVANHALASGVLSNGN